MNNAELRCDTLKSHCRYIRITEMVVINADLIDYEQMLGQPEIRSLVDSLLFHYCSAFVGLFLIVFNF